MLDIPNNLYRIRDEISRIAILNARHPQDLRLIAVSKTQTLETIANAYAAGQRDFAENYIQEAADKIISSKEDSSTFSHDICWHYIGQIQSNKCKSIAKHFDWVHSLSKVKHAQKLDRSRAQHSNSLQICIQVSLEQKSGRNGLALDEVQPFIEQIKNLPNLSLRGLMCVLPEGWSGSKAYDGFNKVHDLFKELKKDYPNLDTLSMGMSSDYPDAIKAGATMLRLGSVIFGARPAKQLSHP